MGETPSRSDISPADGENLDEAWALNHFFGKSLEDVTALFLSDGGIAGRRAASPERWSFGWSVRRRRSAVSAARFSAASNPASPVLISPAGTIFTENSGRGWRC